MLQLTNKKKKKKEKRNYSIKNNKIYLSLNSINNKFYM